MSQIQIDTDVSVDASTDFADLARRALRGEAGIALQSDQAPLDWLERAYERLRPTPALAASLSRAVAGCLTDPAAKLRAQALMFFEKHPDAAGHDLVLAAAKQHRPLFRGIPNPFQDSVPLEWQLFRTLGALALKGDADALALAYAEALRPTGQGGALIAALTRLDPNWVAVHAEEIVKADPTTAGPLLINLQGSPIDVGDVGERIAPLVVDEPMFRSLAEMIDDTTTRRRILARLPTAAP
ncbi:MAG: hypothetical protein JWN44_7220 [Myxococcales bacterium]|nr:hypothetical protein [Myxococcales bacterium]